MKLDFAKMSNFSLAGEVKHERRRGDRPYAGTFDFSNVLELVEPIEYDTTSFEVSADVKGGRAGAQFGYRYSMFENENNSLDYDNPYRSFDSTSSRAYIAPGNGSLDGPATGRNALAPDNTRTATVTRSSPRQFLRLVVEE